MISHDVLTALADIREGRVRLNAKQQRAFLDAVEGLARVMINAPRAGDSAQLSIWYVHERTPALARLADAARPDGPSLAAELKAAREEELRLIRQLRADLAG